MSAVIARATVLYELRVGLLLRSLRNPILRKPLTGSLDLVFDVGAPKRPIHTRTICPRRPKFIPSGFHLATWGSSIDRTSGDSSSSCSAIFGTSRIRSMDEVETTEPIEYPCWGTLDFAAQGATAITRFDNCILLVQDVVLFHLRRERFLRKDRD